MRIVNACLAAATVTAIAYISESHYHEPWTVFNRLAAFILIMIDLQIYDFTHSVKGE